jgi:small subunit ribosomal protein S16
MSVRIRLKKLGRSHRPFFRVCAMDQRSPRDGRVIEELGYYDPMCPETDARVQLKAERVDYWLGVGAQPSEKVDVLIKKYGSNGTHLEAQKEALERLGRRKEYTPAPAEPAAETQEPATADANQEGSDAAPASSAESEPAAAGESQAATE